MPLNKSLENIGDFKSDKAIRNKLHKHKYERDFTTPENENIDSSHRYNETRYDTHEFEEFIGRAASYSPLARIPSKSKVCSKMPNPMNRSKTKVSKVHNTKGTLTSKLTPRATNKDLKSKSYYSVPATNKNLVPTSLNKRRELYKKLKQQTNDNY